MKTMKALEIWSELDPDCQQFWADYPNTNRMRGTVWNVVDGLFGDYDSYDVSPDWLDWLNL